MAEFSWNPFGEEQDERTLGPWRPSPKEADRQLEAEIAQMFPDGWQEILRNIRSDEVKNG